MSRWAFAFGVCLLAPASAYAYSDPSMFPAPVLEGGGGGHYYTGSPAEGYPCDTCHTGGTKPALHVTGLPTRYVPNATYEIALAWSDELKNVAASFELTDEQGRGAGALALATGDDVDEREYCEPRSQRVTAAQLFAADGGRTIASLPDCGASMLRAQWTAPKQKVGPIWLAGSVVASDHAGDVRHDGVTSIAQPIPAYGEALPDLTTRGQCSVVAAGSARTGWSAWLWSALGLALLRRRQLRRH